MGTLRRLLLLVYYISLCSCSHFENINKGSSKNNINNKDPVHTNVPKRIVIGSKPGMTSFSFSRATGGQPNRFPVSPPEQQNIPNEVTSNTIISSNNRNQVQHQSHMESPQHHQRMIPPPQTFSSNKASSNNRFQMRPPQDMKPPTAPQQGMMPPPPSNNIPQQPPPNRSFPVPQPNDSQPPLPPPNQGSGFQYHTVFSTNNQNIPPKFVFTATTFHAYEPGKNENVSHAHADARVIITNITNMVAGNDILVHRNGINSDRGHANVSVSTVQRNSQKGLEATNNTRTGENRTEKMHHFRIPANISDNSLLSNFSSTNDMFNLKVNSVYEKLVTDHINELFANMPIFSFSVSAGERARTTNKHMDRKHDGVLQNLDRLDITPDQLYNITTDFQL